MKISYDGTEAIASNICAAIMKLAPELCDDQLPSFITLDNGDVCDLRIWLEDGDAQIHLGDSVNITDGFVSVIRAESSPPSPCGEEG